MEEQPKNARTPREELRTRARIRIAELAASVIMEGIRWGGIVAIMYFFFRSIESLSGRTTVADVGIKFIADMKFSEVFAYLFGGGGMLYGLKQRQFARRKTEYLATRNTELEKRIDPNRTSSTLPPTGETNAEDRP